MNKALRSSLLTLLFLSSCVDPVELDYRNVKPKLVVEGMITNEPPPYVITIKYSTPLLSYDTSTNKYVENALVQISDESGNATSLQYNNNGTYYTVDSNFIGVPGKTYTLSIQTLEGQKFISLPETMPPVTPVDSVYTNGNLIGPLGNEGYSFYVSMHDPVDQENYYRWTAHGFSPRRTVCPPPPPPPAVNRCFEYCWVRDDYQGLNILSDQFFNGNELKDHFVLFSPAVVNNYHFVEVEQMSLSRQAYQFWEQYEAQMVRTGSIFDATPAQIRGNIVNGADSNDFQLGYFGASAISRKRTKYLDTTDPELSSTYHYPNNLPHGSCEMIYAGSAGSFYPPTGW